MNKVASLPALFLLASLLLPAFSPDPILTISPGSGNIVIQGNPPLPNSVGLWNTGPAVPFTLTVDQPWMRVSPTSGTLPENGSIAATMTMDFANLSVGTYTGTLTASAPGRASVTATFFLNLIPATLSSPTTQLSLSGPASLPATAGPALIRTNSRGNLPYSATASVPWLTVATPTSTLSDLNPGSITVRYVAGSLPAGTHQGSVIVSAPPAAPLTIPVEARLSATAPSVTPTSLSLRAAPSSLLNPTLQVTFASPGPLSVQTSSTGGWLSALSATYSTSPATVALRVNTALATQGLNSGSVTLSANGASLQVPVSVEVVQTISALSAWPPRLELLQNAAAPAPQTLDVRSRFTSSTSFSLESTAPWAAVPSGAFFTPARVALDLNPAQLPTLPAAAFLRLVPSDPAYSTLEIPVSFAPASTGSFVIPQIADGGGFRTRITLLNDSADPASVRLDLFRRLSPTTRDTEPWFPAFQDNPTWNQFTIPPFGAASFETLGLPENAESGWARLQSSTPLRGFAVYRQRQSSGVDQESSVPLLSERHPRFLLPFDQTSGQAAALAIANVCGPSTSILASAIDDSGSPIATADLGSWPPLGHDAFVLSTLLPATANLRGTVEFSASPGCVAPIGLRFTPQGAFTSVDPQPPSPARSLLFPQLADGGEFSTSLVLTNHDTQPAPVTLLFRSSGGERTPSAPWDPGVPTSVLILPGASLTLQSSALASTPVSGWAQASSPRRISGFAVFRRRLPDGGLQEATVAGKPAAASRSTVPFDNTNGLVTSLAVVNASPAQPLSLNATVRLPDGQTLATGSLQLAPGGHAAFELPARFPETATRTGSIEFAAPSGSFYVLPLRFAPGGAFTSIRASDR